MTTEEFDDTRLQQLLTQLVDGQPTAREFIELNQLIQSSPNATERVVDYLLLDSMLRDEHGADSITAVIDMLADPVVDSVRSESAPESSVDTPIGIHSDGRQKSRAYLRAASWILAAAGVLLVAVIIAGHGNTPVFADASEVVAAAVHAHAEPIERIYIVNVERNQSAWSGFVPPRDVRVSTQGNQFWVEMNGARRWAWGREPDGAIWLTPGPRRGMRIEPDEVGNALDDISELYSLNWESLLSTVLRDYELGELESDGPTHVIGATPRVSTLQWIRKLSIEVDRETKAVRRLVIERRLPRRGASTLTFTLVGARVPDDSRYRLEGHLGDDFKVMTRDTLPDRRRAVLANWFGPHAERWIVQPDDSDE